MNYLKKKWKIKMKEYEFDFLAVLGDSIKQRYESLFNLFDEINKNNKIYSVIGCYEIASIIETANTGFNPSPIIAKICEIAYTGCFTKNSLNFQLYKIERMAKNELILICEKETVVVKLLNFAF